MLKKVQNYEPQSLPSGTIEALAEKQHQNNVLIAKTIKDLVSHIESLPASIRNSITISSSITPTPPSPPIPVGSGTSFWRLPTLVQAVATTVEEQDVFAAEGQGSRSIPFQQWGKWGVGGRLILGIPLQYSLEPDVEMVIKVKAGGVILHSMTKIQRLDRDVLMVILDILSISGNTITFGKFSEWPSNMDYDFPEFSPISLDTGGVTVLLQVSVAFSVPDTVSQIRFQNVDFDGIKAPVAL